MTLDDIIQQMPTVSRNNLSRFLEFMELPDLVRVLHSIETICDFERECILAYCHYDVDNEMYERLKIVRFKEEIDHIYTSLVRDLNKHPDIKMFYYKGLINEETTKIRLRDFYEQMQNNLRIK